MTQKKGKLDEKVVQPLGFIVMVVSGLAEILAIPMGIYIFLKYF